MRISIRICEVSLALSSVEMTACDPNSIGLVTYYYLQMLKGKGVRKTQLAKPSSLRDPSQVREALWMPLLSAAVSRVLGLGFPPPFNPVYDKYPTHWH